MKSRSRPTTIWVLGDQLTPGASSFEGVNPSSCTVLMVESAARARQRPYHKQKLVLLWSAMRHFADELRGLGYAVDYREAMPDYRSGLARHVRTCRPSRLRLMESAEAGGSARLAALAERLGLAVELTPNNMFLSDRDEFRRWARGRKTLRMETFYRKMRRRTGLLMADEQPIGGRWNYDTENRQVAPAGHAFPAIPRYTPDAITRSVIEHVRRSHPDHFGELDGFALPVTRAAAESFARDFFQRRLDLFGPYEDAIVLGERALYHSLLSPLLNLGLLEPLTLCREAERRYHQGSARLNSVEGFVRQIIGWREFVYQVYHFAMPDYARRNHLGADLPLPDFYWSGDTDMRCVADAVSTLRLHGLNHHIQRLMITGNFALIAGIDPQAVNEWYWLAYADAYGWVVTPNVLGMALFADGGLLASKPYAASANYIDRMGNCCGRCAYDPRATVGDSACPFNALYWHFLDRNAARFRGNPRLSLVLGGWRKRERRTQEAIRERGNQLRERLRRGERL